MTKSAATAMPSAAELQAITEGRDAAGRTRRQQIQQANVARAEAQVAYYLDRMRKAFAEQGPKAAAEGIGWMSAYDTRGDYVDEGSMEKYDPGFEEAWRRFKAELAPLGYRFARNSMTVHTGSYDTPIERRTDFIVEWAAPWVKNGRQG